MATASVSLARRERGTLTKVVTAGATVGVLDGLAAVILSTVIRGRPMPAQVFKGIAAAVLGPDARTGGSLIVALGLALHFGVALAWSVVYAVAYRRSARLRELTRGTRGALAAGVAYGALVWLTMRLVMLPLTESRLVPLMSVMFFVMLAIHMTVVGPPITLIVRDRTAR